MRTTIELPDEVYCELKIKAAREKKPVREIVLRAVQRELDPSAAFLPRKRFKIPIIPSAHPGTLHLTNEDIDDILASS
jgi:plasmid stability protein